MRENNNNVCPICANSDSKMAIEPHSFIQGKKIKHAAKRGNDEKLQSEVPKALLLPYKKKQIQTGLN